MARAKKDNSNSPFWIPTKKGDSITGKINGFQKLQGKYGGTAVVVGEKLVTLTHGLRKAILKISDVVKIGKDTLSIEYGGKKEEKGKNAFHLFEVKYNGKVIDTSDFETVTDMDTVAGMLAADMEADAAKKGKRKKK